MREGVRRGKYRNMGEREGEGKGEGKRKEDETECTYVLGLSQGADATECAEFSRRPNSNANNIEKTSRIPVSTLSRCW